MKKTLVEQIVEDIKSKIEARVYVTHERLPSIRALASMWKVSKSTVVEAYDSLTAEGIIQPKVGAGFYVCPSITLLDLQSVDDYATREIDPLWVARQSLDVSQDMLKPGCGWLPEQQMYEQGIRQSLRKVSKSLSTLLTEYAPAKGHVGLRRFLMRRLVEQGLEITPENILLTDSGTQAIDMICRLLLCPGDTVLVDNPCYFNFRALLKAHQVNIVSVDYTKIGPNPSQFENSLQQHRPKLYITNSVVHNPTGASLQANTAHQILMLAEKHNVVIIEDDIFADFSSKKSMRLSSMDNLQRVIQIGSFSKTISASLRCGYIAARSDWLDKLTDLKIATGFGSSQLSAELLLQVLTSNGYRKHLQQLQVYLTQRRHEVMDKLALLGIVPTVVPEAGMFLWCQLPQNISALKLTRDCLTQQVMMAPGNVFSVAENADCFVRINVAQMSDKVYHVLTQALK